MSYLQRTLFSRRRFRELALTLFLLVLVGTLAVYFFESDVAGSQINNLFDGLWWSVVTITTVGYGDIVPVTLGGKLVGLILVTAGTGLYLITFVIIGTAISESHEVFQWRRANARLEAMEKELTTLRKSVEFLVSNHPKAKMGKK